jgi:hypothetical protein
MIKHMDRLFGYLNSTIKKGILLGANNTALTVMADASFGIHRDGKSHSGILIFMDNSVLLAKSVKQKLVTLSSTEAELDCLSEGLQRLQPIKKTTRGVTRFSHKKT